MLDRNKPRYSNLKKRLILPVKINTCPFLLLLNAIIVIRVEILKKFGYAYYWGKK